MRSLIELSTRLGRNPLLTQAGSGNTSEKRGGALWIKASGAWMAHADREDSFVPVDLNALRRAFFENREFTYERTGRSGEKLRSSIETAMHGVLPQRVVIHVHSVNAIAWAVRRDAEAELATRLEGLNWRWIPYVASGLPLAQRVAGTLCGSVEPDVFVLGNHGLVVCGEDCEGAEALLQEVEARLRIEPRFGPPADCRKLLRIAQWTNWRPAPDDAVHSLAIDSAARNILRRGTLYPCQAVFLGAKIPVVSPHLPFEPQLARWEYPRYALVDRVGVLFSPEMTQTESEVLAGLARVVSRLSEDAPVRHLSAAEVESVLCADAHRYRSRVETYERAPQPAFG